MSTVAGISTLCNEFTNALTEVLAENAVGPARRGRLARARAAVKKHPECSEHAYFLAVETAFTQWELCKMSVARSGLAIEQHCPQQGENFTSLSHITRCHLVSRAVSAFGGRIQPVDATPFASNLAPWNGMHMEGHARTWFTRKQKAELWGRGKCGQ